MCHSWPTHGDLWATDAIFSLCSSWELGLLHFLPPINSRVCISTVSKSIGFQRVGTVFPKHGSCRETVEMPHTKHDTMREAVASRGKAPVTSMAFHFPQQQVGLAVGPNSGSKHKDWWDNRQTTQHLAVRRAVLLIITIFIWVIIIIKSCVHWAIKWEKYENNSCFSFCWLCF